MDLKSFYKKIDVDSIKNKLPPLKIPKIKSRKIFKSSREDLAQQQSPAEPMGIGSPITPQSLPGLSTFIDRTPTRISTVSSLMNINYGFKDKHESGLSTYKTASNFEDENCPDEFDTREPVSGNSVSRFSDKCKRTYKDFSEFKIKNMFAKKTVVKRTEIEVDIYARQYERDNYLEEQELDDQLEEGGYEFEFKEARRRLSVSSGSISPADSLRSGVPSPMRSELGHLQQNDTPPLLAKRRNAISHAEALRQKLQKSMSYESNDEPPRKPNRSSLWGLNENNHAESGEEQVQVHRTSDSRLSKFKKSMKEGISGGIRESLSVDSGDDQNQSRIGISMARFRKPTKEGTFDGKNVPHYSGDNEMSAQNAGDSRMKRLKKLKKDDTSGDIPTESGDDQPSKEPSRMARFKKSMKEGISEGFLDTNVPAESGDEHPKAGPSRMARLKKSMKDGISEGFSDKNIAAESGDEQPPVSKVGTSRMARFKKSMKEGISEGFSDKHIPTESGDEKPSAHKSGTSKMARFKKSMKEGISEGFSDKRIPTESGDEQPSAHKSGTSKMARFKKSMREGISEGILDRNIPVESGDEQPQSVQKGVSRMARFKKSMREGISEGFSDKNIPEGSGEDQPSAHKTGTSRISRIKASMKEGISDRNIPAESGDEQPKASESRMSKFKKSMKEGMSNDFDSTWNLKGIRNRFTSEETEQKPKKNLQSQESLDEHSDHEKKTWKLSNIHLRRAEPSERNNDPVISSPEGKFSSIKMSINRLKNRKPQRQTSEESETDQNGDSPRQNMSDQLKAGLRKLKMGEQSMTLDEEEIRAPKEPATNRLRNWKKSIKIKRPSAIGTEDNGDEAPPLPASSPPGRSLSLMRKLNHIRSRKIVSEDVEESADAQGNNQQKQKSSNLEKLEQARTKALRKVNAQVQKMKNFHSKSRDLPSEASPEKALRKTAKHDIGENISKPLTSVLSSHSLESALSLDDEDNEEIPPDLPKKTLRKTNNSEPQTKDKISKPLSIVFSSHSMVSALSLDDDEEIPRVEPERALRKPNKPEQSAKSKVSKPLSTVFSSHSMVSALSFDDDEEIPPVLPVMAPRKPNKPEHPAKNKISKPPLAGISSHSMESSLSFDDDEDEEVTPRIFLHQDNSDQYESTLTVAVTRPAPPIPSAVIKEIIHKTKYQAPKTEWIPNKNAISSFLEMTPSPESSTQQLDVSRGHIRKRSMDSNDSDSWIPDNFRNKSCSSSTIAGLNKITENSEPWKVHSVFSQEKLYKVKSIDIFANRDGGAFRDFDDEMKNVPVRRIIAASAESLHKSYGGDTTDDDDDYDNASRITRVKHESPMVSTKAAIETIRNIPNLYESTESNKAYRGSPVPTKITAQIGNSQESLDANYDENDEKSSEEEEDEDNDDDDEAPTMTPSPPPSFSPPPPPLPLRKPPRLVPERNDSMVRLAHPLVKQGSLRRHFSEEIEPSDLGKVNKLITRFEKTPTYENVPRIQLIASDDDNANFEIEEQKSAKTKENDSKKGSVQYSSNFDIDEFEEQKEKNRTQTKEDGGDKKSQNGTNDEEGKFDQKKVSRSSSKRRPAPIPNQTVKLDDSTSNNNNNNDSNKNEIRTKKDQPGSPSPEYCENLDNISIQSPNSIYGSPIGSICLSERMSTSSIYGSPIGATYATRTEGQVRSNRRLSNRSSLRDDDTFYSFESDEENNFYSLGDSSDMRYTIEI